MLLIAWPALRLADVEGFLGEVEDDLAAGEEVVADDAVGIKDGD